jgi:hypothetical protein
MSGHRDVEDVQVLPADQVQQQVERAFERLEDDFERVRRDVQVLGICSTGWPSTIASGISCCWGACGWARVL